MFHKSKVRGNLKAVRKTGAVTRSNAKKQFKLARRRTEKFKKSLLYGGRKKWNNLPVEVQTLISKKEFTSKISALISARPELTQAPTHI